MKQVLKQFATTTKVAHFTHESTTSAPARCKTLFIHNTVIVYSQYSNCLFTIQ